MQPIMFVVDVPGHGEAEFARHITSAQFEMEKVQTMVRRIALMVGRTKVT